MNLFEPETKEELHKKAFNRLMQIAANADQVPSLLSRLEVLERHEAAFIERFGGIGGLAARIDAARQYTHDRVSEALTAAGQRMDEMDERLCGNWADACNHIGALEAGYKQNAADVDDFHRVQRWHDTYNAALPECIRQLAGVNDDDEVAARACVMASIHADRAHGPLEGTAPVNPASRVLGGLERLHRDLAVQALVKAAREAWLRYADLQDYDPGLRAEMSALAAALKPFDQPSAWKHTCAVCGTEVPDLGSLKTRYRCDACI